MRIYLSVLLVAGMLSITAPTGCISTEAKTSITGAMGNPASAPQATTSADDVRRISIAKAHAAFESGKAVIVDVRTESAYRAGHIKGAQLIPLNEIGARSSELPRDKTIILYCSCPAEQSSIAAAQRLKSKDVNNTAALVGGYQAWKDAGHPVEESTK